MTIETVLRQSKPKQKINFKQGRVEMSHGSGGKAMHQLIEQLFFAAFSNEYLRQGNDQACFSVPKSRLVMTTDSYVISPLFFPGGDIGSLAVHGTINDIAMGGAKPLYLSVGFILEEGFPLSDLQKIVNSMGIAARKANVSIITGDTKVLEKGKGDGVFITTTGIGIVPEHVCITNTINPGDKIILSGSIGDHGIAVMSQRQNLKFETQIISDSAALHDMTAKMFEAVPQICCLRDPTRGGVASTLNEWADQHKVGFFINENKIPIHNAVRGACELLGIDPLYVANEGKCVVVCAAQDAEKLLSVMRQHPQGKEAVIIGEAIPDPENFVQMRTSIGGMRIVDWLSGDQLPRIC
ncbi:MAG: hydrogenase expression/formation protein HypE [Gammaproteobacteria bacterium]|nr:hydrogenase expression/formation protein HypE [Gammaproteobacteria bacterium]